MSNRTCLFFSQIMNHKERLELIHASTRIGISLIALIAGLCFASGGDATLQKVGIGFVGTVIGYWLR